jgi:hypothetical protein
MKHPQLVAIGLISLSSVACAPASATENEAEQSSADAESERIDSGEESPEGGPIGSSDLDGETTGSGVEVDTSSGGSAATGGDVGTSCIGSKSYQVNFDVTWTEANFPTDYPVDGMLVATWDAAHMSPLIGGSHGPAWFPWKAGEPSSEGTEEMAEKGDPSTLEAEVQTAISGGQALSIARGSGVGYPPGADGATFTVSEAFPLITLASMLAPSPDWFAGVSGVSLCHGGEWASSLQVDALVYDAGTDNGQGYNYGWQDTQPPAPIAPLAAGYFADTNVVGTFTFTAQ